MTVLHEQKLMTFFAVMVECKSFPMFNGKAYANLPGMAKGQMACLAGEINGKEYATVCTMGSALREKADATAQKIGGFVVTVHSKYWPSDSDIILAMKQ
jgi:hypothetical protein